MSCDVWQRVTAFWIYKDLSSNLTGKKPLVLPVHLCREQLEGNASTQATREEWNSRGERIEVKLVITFDVFLTPFPSLPHSSLLFLESNYA